MSAAVVVMVASGLLMVVVGIAVVVVAELGRIGRLRRNAFTGIRTPATMRSDETWLAAHRAGFGPTAAGGAVSVVSGIVAIVLAVAEADAWPAFVVVLVGAVLLAAGAIAGVVAGVAAARRIGDGPSSGTSGRPPS